MVARRALWRGRGLAFATTVAPVRGAGSYPSNDYFFISSSSDLVLVPYLLSEYLLQAAFFFT